MKNQLADPIVAELNDIKRLIILQLLKNGVTQLEIATALGVDNSVISRMVPLRKLNKNSKK